MKDYVQRWFDRDADSSRCSPGSGLSHPCGDGTQESAAAAVVQSSLRVEGGQGGDLFSAKPKERGTSQIWSRSHPFFLSFCLPATALNTLRCGAFGMTPKETRVPAVDEKCRTREGPGVERREASSLHA
ncbi:hypothetical protein MTO96_020364 [Rhipicephalus appendiculatus]